MITGHKALGGVRAGPGVEMEMDTNLNFHEFRDSVETSEGSLDLGKGWEVRKKLEAKVGQEPLTVHSWAAL